MRQKSTSARSAISSPNCMFISLRDRPAMQRGRVRSGAMATPFRMNRSHAKRSLCGCEKCCEPRQRFAHAAKPVTVPVKRGPMSENEAKAAAVPIPAATILILRDADDGMEVFMVKRHHQIDFVAGALVFPGGKVARGDFDEGLGELTDGTDAWPTEMRAIGAAAVREAFEESGILLARDAD